MEGSPGIVFGHVILEAGEKRSCGDQRPVEAVKQPWKLRRGPFHVLLELNSTRDMHELVTANAERCCGVDIRRTNSKKKKKKGEGCQWPPVPSSPFVAGIVRAYGAWGWVFVFTGVLWWRNTRGKLCRGRAAD